MVTIKDLAVACGISVTTVSKALNNYDDVSLKTKEYIRSTAARIGYFPNSQARALKTNHTYCLGTLFVDDSGSGLTHEYYSQILNSFKISAEARGYDITFINQNIGNRVMSYLEHCIYRKVDGVVVTGVDFSQPSVIELINSKIPIVTIDYNYESHASVCAANFDGIQTLVQYAFELGHRKIAYIHGQKSDVTEQRLGSFYKTAAKLGIRILPEYVQEGLYHNPAVAGCAVKKLLSLEERPTCILFPDDFSAVGGMNFLEKEGFSVPYDISVIGYDGILLSQIIQPKLTTIKQNTKKIGEQAAIALINQIELPEGVNRTVVVPGSLLTGTSVLDLNHIKNILSYSI